jgi:ribosomally synthesized peptide (two-chain TOMM family)
MSHEKNRTEAAQQPSKAVTIETLRTLEEWHIAWTKAVALVWSNPDKYENALKEDPHDFLAQHCAYQLHQNVTLEVKGSANADADAPSGTDDPDAVPMPEAHLTMWLPRRPRTMEDAPLALVEYMNSRSYPCFCC